MTERLKSILERVRKLAEESISDYPNVEIYLTGQGSKLFLVRELIQDTFPDIPLFDQYQESAVCQGLAKMAGVLTGDVTDLLLLDNLHLYVYILCNRYDEDEDIIYIGEDNHVFHRLINPERGKSDIPSIAIPCKRIFRIAPTGFAQGETFEVKLCDYSPSDDSHTLIESKIIPVRQVSTDIYFLIVDIDASSNLSMNIITEEEYTRRRALREIATDP